MTEQGKRAKKPQDQVIMLKCVVSVKTKPPKTLIPDTAIKNW